MSPQLLTVTGADPGPPRRELVERATLLAWSGAAWLCFAGPLAFVAGLLASSAALGSFGLLAAIEGIGTLAILLGAGLRSALPEAHRRRVERVIAVQFLVLGPLVAFESVRVFLADEHAEVSALGMAIATFSLVALLGLGRAAAGIGGQLDSLTLQTRARSYATFGYLAAAVLLSLLANAVVDFWLLDPLVAFVIAATALARGLGYWWGEVETWTPEREATPPGADQAPHHRPGKLEGARPR